MRARDQASERSMFSALDWARVCQWHSTAMARCSAFVSLSTHDFAHDQMSKRQRHSDSSRDTLASDPKHSARSSARTTKRKRIPFEYLDRPVANRGRSGAIKLLSASSPLDMRIHPFEAAGLAMKLPTWDGAHDDDVYVSYASHRPRSDMSCSLFNFPREEAGALSVRRKDLRSLNGSEYLNDTAIYFGLQ